jgi:hypothetical protein
MPGDEGQTGVADLGLPISITGAASPAPSYEESWMSGESDRQRDIIGLDRNEVAIILREDDDDVLTRLVFGAEPASDEEVPYAVQLAVALITRLQEDEDFHQDMLDWFDTYTAMSDDEEDDEEIPDKDRD